MERCIDTPSLVLDEALTSPISQGDKRLNFQITTVLQETQKVKKVGYWGTKSPSC